MPTDYQALVTKFQDKPKKLAASILANTQPGDGTAIIEVLSTYKYLPVEGNEPYSATYAFKVENQRVWNALCEALLKTGQREMIKPLVSILYDRMGWPWAERLEDQLDALKVPEHKRESYDVHDLYSRDFLPLSTRKTLESLSGKPLLDLLREFVNDPDPKIRGGAANALSGISDEGAFDLLKLMINDADDGVRLIVQKAIENVTGDYSS